MKPIRLILILSLLVAALPNAQAAAWDLSFTQFDGSNRPRSYTIQPAASSLLGFGPTKQITNVTIGSGLALSSGGVLSANAETIAGVIGLQAALDAKQATLVSGTNIKTLNGESILGAGNLVIAGAGGDVVAGSITTNQIAFISNSATKAIGSVPGFTYNPDTGVITFPGDVTIGGDINLTEPVGVPAGGTGFSTIGENQIYIGGAGNTLQKVNLIAGDNVNIVKSGGNLTFSSTAAGTGTFPLALYAMIPTADVGSLPSDWFVGGLYGTTAWSNGDMTGVKQSLGTVAVPVASPPPGVVLTGQVVTLTSDTADAFFRTTTSGTDPTYDTGTLGNTFTVTTAGTWEAIAGKPGHKPSAVVPFAYTVDAVPTLATAEILASGTTLRTTFSEAVNFGAGGQGGMALTLSSGSVTVGTSTTTMPATVVDWPLTGGPVLQTPVTATLAYTQPGNGIEDSAGQDLLSFGPAAVTNSSTQGTAVPVALRDGPDTGGYTIASTGGNTVGYRFEVSGSGITVHALGFERLAGASASRFMALYGSDGITEIASVTVPSANGAVGTRVYENLATPISLAAGTYHFRGHLGGYNEIRGWGGLPIPSTVTTSRVTINATSNTTGSTTGSQSAAIDLKYTENP
jgi:hypothetical protein